MSREWKPGTVAMVTDVTGVVRPMVRIGHDPAERCWHGAESNGDLRCLADGQEQDVRPLVVIDPESLVRDDEADDGRKVWELVNCLRRIAEADGNGRTWRARLVSRIADEAEKQLRAPKPAEPRGLGAVVEAAAYSDEIRTFVRGPGSRSPWFDASGNGHEWNELDLDRIVAEGVTA